MDGKERKITHVGGEDSLNLKLTNSAAWFKQHKQKLASELRVAKDEKSLSVLGYKASILNFNLERSSRRARVYSQRVHHTIQKLLQYQDRLHHLFIHPLTGELRSSQSTSIFMTFSSWCFWKVMSAMNYGRTLYPLLRGSCELISQRAQEDDSSLAEYDYLLKAIQKVKGQDKQACMHTLKHLASFLGTRELPHLNSPINSYAPFPGDLILHLKDKTQFILHLELLLLHFPYIERESSREDLKQNVLNLLNQKAEKYKKSSSWNIIFLYIYNKDMFTLGVEGLSVLSEAYDLAFELKLDALCYIIDNFMSHRVRKDNLYSLNKELKKSAPKTLFQNALLKNHPLEDISELLSTHIQLRKSFFHRAAPSINDLKLYNLDVHLKGGVKKSFFPIQQITLNTDLSKSIEEKGFLDLTRYSEKEFEQLVDYLNMPHNNLDTLLENESFMELIFFLDINQYTHPLINAYIAHKIKNHDSFDHQWHLDSMRLPHHRTILTTEHFYNLSQAVCNEHLKSLDLSHCNLEHGHELEDIATKFIHLNRLNLSYCRKIRPESLRAFVKECNYIRMLRLKGLDALNDEDIAAIIQSSPDIRILDISSCKKVTGTCLLELKAYSYSLRELRVSNLPYVTSSLIVRSLINFPMLECLDALNIRSFTSRFLQHLKAKSPFLRRLCLSSLNKPPKIPKGFLSAFKLIETLHLPGIYGVTNKEVQDLFSKCSSLKSLDLSFCSSLTDEAFLSNINTDSFEELKLSGIKSFTGKGICELAKKSQLKKLNLHGCTGLQKEYLLKLLEHTPQLNSIDLSGSSCVDDELIIQLANHCPMLKELRLSSCHHLSGKTFDKLLDACPHLEMIDLGSCNSLDSRILSILLKGAEKFKGIGLSFQGHLPKKDLIKLIQKAKNLERLSLNHCLNVDDSFLEALSDSCLKIKDLRLYYCKKVSVKGLANFLRAPSSPYLESLEIRGTHIKENEIISHLSTKRFLRHLYMSSCTVNNRNILTVSNPDLSIYAHTY